MYANPNIAYSIYANVPIAYIAMPTPLSLAEHTLFAELLELSLDAMFNEEFPINGSFSTRAVRNREGTARKYFYYQGYNPNAGPGEPKRYQKYVGPTDDLQIADRVARFLEIKTGRKSRVSLVSALAGLGIPRPPVQMGKIIEALAKAGLFRMRAVLIGTAAYQTYPALLGVRLRTATAITGDIDFAQFRAISISIGDKSEPILETLKEADPTFRAVPHMSASIASTRFQNAGGFRLDILTPNRGSDHHMGKAVKMGALADISADPLRLLDFLIFQPVRSVVLYGPGISVNVPSPQRYALHKLIAAVRRIDDEKNQLRSSKDIAQASELILAFRESGRAGEISSAFDEAWNRGPRWREALVEGASHLPKETFNILLELTDGKITQRLPKRRPIKGAAER